MTDQQTNNSLETFLDGDADAHPRIIEDSASDVGTRIAEARAAAGRTQTDIANQLGVKVSTIDRWEQGIASPRSNRLAALAGILGVSLSWLIVGYGSEPTSSDDLQEIKATLSRVQTQLTDTLNDVELLTTRLDNVVAND
jgi:transcriptional regulator with XRE-family HTH domain